MHFYQKKGAKRKRRMPESLGKHDLKILHSVRRKAYRLDLQLSLCGARFGWAGILGLIPWIGDLLALAFAMQLLRKAEQIEGGLPAGLRQKMIANIAFDFLIGLIPIVGDFINILYKCNLRNFVLLEAYLAEKHLVPVLGTTHKVKGERVANEPQKINYSGAVKDVDPGESV